MSRTVLHRLDPRSKLVFVVGFSIAAYLRTEIATLGILTLLVLGLFLLGRISPLSVLYRLRFVIGFLALAPVIAVIHPGPPWIDLTRGIAPALASYRVILVVSVGIIYVHTTSITSSQAAIAWVIPGRPGRLVAIGTGVVIRLIPLIRSDIATGRDAMRVRQAEKRPWHERIRFLGTLTLVRGLARADRLGDAMRTRCLSWNPTMPELQWSRFDIAPIAIASALLLFTVI